MKLESILDQIDLKNYALPEFQRGYVWNRDQVRKLMTSLFKGYPIGSLLVWVTQSNPNITKGNGNLSQGTVHLILDGQQRITTLYGIIRGNQPPFFEGDPHAFDGLYFNVEEDVFEFYMASKMLNDSNWISVTELMGQGAGNYVTAHTNLLPYLDKLNAINNIKMIDLPIQEVSGADKTVDIVVEIFNNVNSGGTKLSKGDLALAKLCAQWPEARQELRGILARFKNKGYIFKLDWLLRCITVYLTDQPYFSALATVDIAQFQTALTETEKLIGTVLDHVGSRLGLDHDRVLPGKFAFVVMLELIKQAGGRLFDNQEWDKILYWYIQTFLWGRYSSSTESALAQDLNVLANGEGVDGLIKLLRKNRGDLLIRPEDFIGWSSGSRFYPLLYMMTRMGHAIDWKSGVLLSNTLLGKNASLDVHHIFPKKRLYEAGYHKAQVNALANYTFLTKDTNILIKDSFPNEYLPEIQSNQPEALKTHWVPEDASLWEMDRYLEFMNTRRDLLAKAANEILDGLYSSNQRDTVSADFTVYDEGLNVLTPEEEAPFDEEEAVVALSCWVEEQGLPGGEIDHELIDANGNLIAILDIAWPEGIQSGLSQPVTVMINEDMDDYHKASQAGYTYFTNIEDFKRYVEDTFIS